MAVSGKTLLKKKLSVKERIEPFYLGGSVAYNSDGTNVFCLFRNHIKLLSVETGKQIGHFGTEEDEELSCFALSPNDQMLVSASRGLLMVLWDPEVGTPTRTWKSAHQLPVEVMAFDSTSTLLASGGADGTVKIYDMVHSYCTHNLRVHKGVVKLVQFHPDISRLQLFTSSGDFKIRIWNLQTSEILAVLDKHFSLVTSIAFDRTGDSLFSSSCDRVLVAWNLKTFQPLTVTALSEDIRSVLAIPATSLSKTLEAPVTSGDASTPLSGDDDLALCVGSSGKIRVVDPLKSKILFSQKESVVGGYGGTDEEQVDSVVASAIHLRKSGAIAIISNYHHIFHLSLEDLSTLEKVFMGNNDEVLAIRLINEDRLLAVVTNSPDIKLYEVESFSCSLLRGHEKTVMGIDSCESRRLLASVSKDATCRIWSYHDPSNIVCVGVASGHAKSIIACAVSKLDGSFVVTGGEDMSLKCWKVSSKISSNSAKTGDGLKKLKSIFTSAAAHAKDINSIALSPNDRFVATGSQDKTAKLWSREDGKLLGIFSGHRRGVWCVKFSTIDQIIATSSADGTLKLWALSDFTCIKSIDAHDASVLNVSFVTRGMQLVSSGADGLVKLWTIKNSECSGSFDLHEAKIWALETAADGMRVITGAADGKILFLEDVTELEEIEEAGKREKKILQDQSLANCLHEKDFVKAFLLALDLNRPRDLLKISNSLLSLPDWRPRLESILRRLRPDDQVDALLSHVKAWNANGRTCGVAQTMLELLFRARDTDELVKDVPNIVETVESLTPFTQRHYDRLQLLTQQSTFLDYLWNSMKLEALEDDDDDADGESMNRSADDDKPMDEDDDRDSDSGVMDEDSGTET